jgi:hypothetical protein
LSEKKILVLKPHLELLVLTNKYIFFLEIKYI